MDYSKWKKIGIILFVISLVLNICSKVFGYYALVGNNGVTYEINDGWGAFPYIFIAKQKGQDSYGLFVSDEPAVIQLYSTNYHYVEFKVANVRHQFWNTTLANLKVQGPWSVSTSGNAYTSVANIANYDIVASNYDIYSTTGSLIYDVPDPYLYPYFSTPDSEINSLTFDRLYIEPADYGTSDPLYLHVLQITQTVTDDTNTYYYYTDNEFILNNKSTYYTQFFDSDYYYYGVPRRELGFNVDSVYLLVLSDNPDIITNSVGPIVEDTTNGIFEAVSVNTENIYTYEQVIDDNIQNIQNDLTNTDTDISDEEIENVFQYDNNNSALTNNHDGFFTRLLALFSDLSDYNLSDDSVIEIPLPNSSKKIYLHSNIIYQYITDPLRSIIGAFWVYVFYMYAWKFFNYIFIEIQTGNILDEKDEDFVPGAIHGEIL